MSQRAQVTSVEAIDAFRARLILFLGRARACLEEATDEVQRTQAWLEHDRRAHWEREFRRRHRRWEDAQQALFSAKLSPMRAPTAVQAMAVEKAKRALDEAEEKKESVKRWSREFELRAQPLAKQVDQLLTYLSTDLVKAVASLSTTVQLLERYAAVASPGSTAHPEAPAVSGEAGVDPSVVPGEAASDSSQAGEERRP